MIENDLVAALLIKLRREVVAKHGGVVYKHAEGMTTGVPDVSVTLNGSTSWWEFKLKKFGRPLSGTGLQKLRMRELGVAGVAWYVVWEEGASGIVIHALLVRPRDLELLMPVMTYAEFGFDEIVDYILSIHRIM